MLDIKQLNNDMLGMSGHEGTFCFTTINWDLCSGSYFLLHPVRVVKPRFGRLLIQRSQRESAYDFALHGSTWEATNPVLH